MTLKLHFLGDPFVEKSGERIVIPLRKAEAIVFHLAFEGRLSRERLKLLFWGDKDDDQASNNLRNALYLLRRALSGHFVVDRRHVLLENFETDIAEIERIADPNHPVPTVVFEEPLRGLDMPGSSEFDEWLAQARTSIEKKISDSLKARTLACYDEGLSEELIESLKAQLVLDPFDEYAVMELMELYREIGRTAKGVELYTSFRSRMEKELGILPGERSEELFRRLVLSQHESSKMSPGEFFCCREHEIESILDLLGRNRDKTVLLFVHGEAGVGKTALVNRILDLLSAGDTHFFVARPSPVGERYPYSSFNTIASRIGEMLRASGARADPTSLSTLSGVFHDFMSERGIGSTFDVEPTLKRDPANLGKMIAGLLRLLSADSKPIFILEDMHWFDPHSLLLLKALLSELEIPATLFMTSRPESASAISELLYNIRTRLPKEVLSVPLAPFDPNETMRFCRAFLPEALIARKGEDFFVKESEGMPLLLVEMTRILSENPDADCPAGLKRVILSRMEELSPLQREILATLSVFGRGSCLDHLAAVMGRSSEDISEMLEDLLKKRFVFEEKEGNRFHIDFFHANVRECVYETVPGFKKAQMHSRIAEVLSTEYAPQIWNPSLSSIICHHYTMAGQRTLALRQHLKEMSFHITLNHDLFPMIRDETLRSCSIPFSGREATEQKVQVIRDLLHDINREGEANIIENRRLEASYLELWGGYLINWGAYREGRIFIDRALKLAKEHAFDDIQIHCLEHMGHHFLQTDNSVKLLQTAREMLRLAKKLGKEHYFGLALRYIGMSKLIEHDFAKAEEIFRHSIRVFEELSLTGRNFTLNLLASLCYIGEIHQWTGDADTAMVHFEYCIRRCTEAGLFWGRSHFHAHAADVALDAGDWEGVRRHVDAGSKLFESSQGGRCGSLLYSLKAMNDAMTGMEKEALLSLEKGEMLSRIGKKTWRAAQFMAKAWIARMKERGEVDPVLFEVLLPETSRSYAESAERLYIEIGAAKRADFVRSTLLQ